MFDRDKLDDIKNGAKSFEESTQKAIKKRPERKENFISASGDEVERLYSPADMENIDFMEEIGFPGQYPYTRGVQPTMYRGRLWTMRMYAGFATAQKGCLLRR